MKQEKTYEEILHSATFGECFKEKDKKFFWRFGTKKLNNEKTNVVFYYYEFRGRKTSTDYFELHDTNQMYTFMNVVLSALGSGHPIIYYGKKGTKPNLKLKGFKVGF